MKYMVISDIHGDAACLKKALQRWEEEQAQALLVLGDLLYHGPRNPIPQGYAPKECAVLLNQYKKVIIAVRGNCDADVDQMMLDFAITAPYMLLPASGGRRICMTHGHLAEEMLHLQEGDLLLSGHTHVPGVWEKEMYTAMNPGSISLPKEETPHTYAVLEEHQIVIKTLEADVWKTANW